MAKAKNKKRYQADILSSKKSIVKSKKHNPFEVHVNKEKYSILGRQLKHDRGFPGVSRSKALKHRKETLGQEYKNKNKSNSFKDKRIGEKSMTKEEAATARFVAERLSQMNSNQKRQSVFNLNEDCVLTHKGQTLEEIEQFDDPVSNDEDDEEIGKLDAQFTSTAHFGGGQDEDELRDRKVAIDDLIAEQKRRKNEISKEKEEVSEMTQILDANWRSLLPLMSKLSKDEDVKPKPDGYDRALREMIFEPRGAVTDKLQSDAYILKEEKQRLEKLEKERVERMLGITETKKMNHRSADDLDDGYYVQPLTENQQTLAYDANDEKKDEDQVSDEDLSSEDADQVSDEDLSSEDEQQVGDEVLSSEEEDQVSDKKLTSEDEDQVSDEESSSVDDNKMNDNIPYSVEIPATYGELSTLLKNRTAECQHVILEQMIKCIPESKERINVLFAFILQHINDVFSNATTKNINECFKILDRMCPHLYELAHMNPEKTTISFQGVIKEKLSDFQENENQYPDLDTIVFFKLISPLYSTSDFRHPVCTPSFLFISQILSKCKIKSRADISKGLFLVTAILEYTLLSKRFLPSALNFVRGVLFLCIRKPQIEVERVIPPFKSKGILSELLVLGENEDMRSLTDRKLSAADFLEVKINNSFKVRAMNIALNLTNEFLTLLFENIGAQYMAEPFSNILNKLELENYPNFVQQSVKKCENIISKINEKKFQYLVPPSKKPKTLRLMEPLFDKVYDDKRSHKPGNKDTLVHKGMIRKVKSEKRGAMREIRRDNAFLAKVQLKKRMESDAERKERVRRIFSEASLQQSELNAMARKKKHM